MATKTAQLADALWKEFPVITEYGKPKAFIVDINVFRQIQIILDNLQHKESESEDIVIATSKAFQKLLNQVEREDNSLSSDWRREFHAI